MINILQILQGVCKCVTTTMCIYVHTTIQKFGGDFFFFLYVDYVDLVVKKDFLFLPIYLEFLYIYIYIYIQYFIAL